VLKGWVAPTRKMPCLGLGVRRLLWTRPNKHTQAQAQTRAQRAFHVRYVTTGIYGVSYREGCVYSHSSLPVHIRRILLVQGGVSLPVSFAPHALIWPSVLESLVSQPTSVGRYSLPRKIRHPCTCGAWAYREGCGHQDTPPCKNTPCRCVTYLTGRGGYAQPALPARCAIHIPCVILQGFDAGC
jgi:hypothetical protein